MLDPVDIRRSVEREVFFYTELADFTWPLPIYLSNMNPTNMMYLADCLPLHKAMMLQFELIETFKLLNQWRTDNGVNIDSYVLI